MLKPVEAMSAFLVMIDIQERLMPAIFNKEEVTANSKKLLISARELSIPVIVSEQNPKGLGATIPELSEILPEGSHTFQKNEFSCCDNPAFGDAFLNMRFTSGTTKDTAIVFGVETHICVLSTVLHLLNDYGLNVVVAADASGSRTEANHVLGLEALRSTGSLVVPSETVIYQLLRRAGTPEFKKLLPLFKQ